MSRGSFYSFVKRLLLRYASESGLALELGCGAAVYRRVLPPGRYIGSDIYNPHYQAAGDIDVCCSATALPFRTDTFDLVFSQAAIDYMPDLEKVLREGLRVLRPSGRMLIITYRESVLRRIHKECAQQGIPHYGMYSRTHLLNSLSAAGYKPVMEIPKPPDFDGKPWQIRLKKLLSETPVCGKVLRAMSNWRIFLGVKPGHMELTAASSALFENTVAGGRR